MAELTKAQIQVIENVLHNLKRAQSFLFDESIAVTRRTCIATTSLHYVRPDGSVLYEIEKTYGSDLIGLADAIQRLEALVE